MSDKKDLQGLIFDLEEFLQERGKSDGGYAEVKSRDVRQLREIIYKIIGAKWERDPDGDLPIEFEVIDRILYWPSHYNPVPYKNGFQQALSNLITATDHVQREVNKRQFRLRE